MGRRVRRVPAGWEHPVDVYGNLVPMFEASESIEQLRAEYEAERAAFYADGLDKKHGCTFCEWNGCGPKAGDYMPYWAEEDRTHYQMYEDTSEGTPISPVRGTPEALADWLYTNGASWFGNETASYEAWLSLCKVR